MSHAEVQTQIALWSDPIKRTPVCSQTKITGSGRKFERITVWTMVWSSSDQESIWSEKSDHRRIRAHLSLIINDSRAIGYNQKCFWTQSGLIKDHFECLIFSFFVFFYWEMLTLQRGNSKAEFWSGNHLNPTGTDQKKESSW